MFLAFGMVCASGIVLHAESYQLTAQIPFEFQVGEQTMSPGHYLVEKRWTTPVPDIRNQDSGKTIFVASQGQTLTGQKPLRLVFHRCGDQYFLAEIWSEYGVGSKVSPSRTEKEALKAEPKRQAAVVYIDLHRAD
jgi:hypothetical protein